MALVTLTCHKVCSIGHLPLAHDRKVEHTAYVVRPVVLKWEWVYEGSCASWWLWGLVAPGLGRLKPDTTGSSHRGRPASDFNFPHIIYIPSLGVKVQSNAHYSSINMYTRTQFMPHFGNLTHFTDQRLASLLIPSRVMKRAYMPSDACARILNCSPYEHSISSKTVLASYQNS